MFETKKISDLSLLYRSKISVSDKQQDIMRELFLLYAKYLEITRVPSGVKIIGETCSLDENSVKGFSYFLNVNLIEFLHSFPFYIADVEKIEKIRNYLIVDDYSLAINILIIKKNCKFGNKCYPSLSVIDKIYFEYCQVFNGKFGFEKSTPIFISDKNIFTNLFCAIFFKPLKTLVPYEQFNPLYKSTIDKANIIIPLMKNKLQLNIPQQIHLLSQYYGNITLESVESIKEGIDFSPFVKKNFAYRHKEKIDKIFEDIYFNLKNSNPMVMLESVIQAKKRKLDEDNAITYKSKPKDNRRQDNSTLEKTFVIPLLDANTDLDLFVLNPSITFIAQLCINNKFNRRKIVFGCENTDVVEIMNFFILNDEYTGNGNCKNFIFCNLDKFKNLLTASDSDNERILYVDTTPSLVYNKNISYSDFKNYSKIFSIIGISTDDCLDDKKSFLHATMIDNIFQHIDLLYYPERLSGTFPKRKFIWQVFRSSMKCINYLSPKFLRTEKQDIVLNIDINDLNTEDSIDYFLDYYSVQRYNAKKTPEKQTEEKKRSFQDPINFTPEIEVGYSVTKKYDEANRITMYMQYVSNREKGGHRYSIDQTTKKYTKKIKLVEIENFLKTKYPYSLVVKGKNKGLSIQKITSDFFLEKIRLENISLRTWIYICPRTDNLLSTKGQNILDTLFQDSFSLIKLSELSEQNILEYIEGADISFEEGLHTFGILIDQAKQKNLLYQNVLQDYIGNRENAIRRFNQVRTALAKKSFTENEFREYYKLLEKKRKSKLYIGALIQLFTGLESNEICALQWKDFIENKNFGFFSLFVYKQVSNDGKVFSFFQNPNNEMRFFPCSVILEKELSLLQKQLKSTEQDIDDIYIIHERKNKPCCPSDLSEYTRELISALNISDIIISIPRKNTENKYSNLSSYKGAFFRENFRFWGITKAQLNDDEIEFLLGNNRRTTFGIHYCDFLSESSQAVLYAKLNRIDSIVLYGSNKIIDEKEVLFRKNKDKNYCECESATPNPIAIDLQIGKTNSSDEVVEIKSKYGIVWEII